MKAIEQQTLERHGRLYTTILREMQKSPFSSDDSLLKTQILSAREDVRRQISSERDRHVRSVEELNAIIVAIEEPLDAEELSVGFDAIREKKKATEDGDVQGQILLEEAEEISSGIAPDVEAGIIEALRNGCGKNKAMELVAEKALISIEDAKEAWETLVRIGTIYKEGRNWVTKSPEEHETQGGTQANFPSVKPKVPDTVVKEIFAAIDEGLTRVQAIARTAERTGLLKPEVGGHWDQMLRDGWINQENGAWYRLDDSTLKHLA